MTPVRNGIPQAWIDRAMAIETAAAALVEAVYAAIDRAQQESGRLYAANALLLDTCALAVIEARDVEEPAFPKPSPAAPAEECQRLLPDDYDMGHLRHGGVASCPCCAGTAITFARFFPHSGIYQAYVHCAHCDVQVFKNARDLGEARRLAADTWSKCAGGGQR